MKIMKVYSICFIIMIWMSNSGAFSQSDPSSTQVTLTKDGKLSIGRNISLQLASKSYNDNVASNNKPPLFIMKNIVTIIITQGRPTIIDQYDAVESIYKKQDNNRKAMWMSFLKIQDDDDNYAMLSASAFSRKDELEYELKKNKITIKVGLPFDRCDVLKLIYCEHINKSTDMVSEYLIDPCTNTLTQKGISLQPHC